MTLDFEPRRDLMMAFATPLAQMTVSEAATINPAIKAAILAKQAGDPGTTRSNVGGWHSKDDLLDWPVAELAVLKAAMETAARHMMSVVTQGRPFDARVELHAWANVTRRGGYNAPHNHAKNHWSGVYYVEPGRPDPGVKANGQIELQDPRGRSEMAGTPLNPFGQAVTVPPRAGLMILFPSWLYHWVHPYQGEDERVSIAFNARIEDFKLHKKEPTGG